MIDELEKAIGYKFKDKSLLREAVTHPSVCDNDFNYERLEFLGDSVLGLAVAELIMRGYPGEKEGALARRQSSLVSGDVISAVAEKLDIGKYIMMSQGEESIGGRSNKSNLEDSTEAIIGAIYLDGGFDSAREFIVCHWQELVNEMVEPPKEPKTALQEWAQKRGLSVPKYLVKEAKGPSHAPEFCIEVSVEGLPKKQEVATSKKQAEKLAAAELLSYIRENYGE